MKKLAKRIACVAAAAHRNPTGKQLRHGLFHPHIHGEGLPEGKAEQQHAVGHLGAHPLNGHQLGFGLVHGQAGQLNRVNFTAGHLLGGIQQVGCPPARPQKSQIFYGKPGHPLCCGKGIAAPFQRLAQALTEPLHNGPNAGNVVVLANNEGAQCFKKGLAQHTNARVGLHTGSQTLVAGAKFLLQGRVVQV